MAMKLEQDHIRAIDQLRARLSQLSTSLGLLKGQLEASDPLPSWPALQAASTSLGTNLEDVANVLSIQRNLFTSLHAYPLPTFPGAQQEGLLQQLLRKKLDPKAEAWIEESRALRQAENGLQGSGHETGTLADEDYRELWSWAKETQLEQLRELAEVSAWDDAYTIKEREDGVENVVTGIKRDLDKNEQDDDKMDESDAESEGEGLASVKSSVPLESLLSFASGQDVAGLG